MSDDEKKIKAKSLLRRQQRQRKRQEATKSDKSVSPVKIQRLTTKESRLIEELPKHETRAEAAIAAGYTSVYPVQAASRALSQIVKKSPEIMKELGLDTRAVVDKHIRPLLEANDIRQDKYGGNYTVPDNSTRLRAAETVLKLNDAFPREEVTDGHTPTGVIFRLELADDGRAKAITAAISLGRGGVRQPVLDDERDEDPGRAGPEEPV